MVKPIMHCVTSSLSIMWNRSRLKFLVYKRIEAEGSRVSIFVGDITEKLSHVIFEIVANHACMSIKLSLTFFSIFVESLA